MEKPKEEYQISFTVDDPARDDDLARMKLELSQHGGYSVPEHAKQPTERNPTGTSCVLDCVKIDPSNYTAIGTNGEVLYWKRNGQFIYPEKKIGAAAPVIVPARDPNAYLRWLDQIGKLNVGNTLFEKTWGENK